MLPVHVEVDDTVAAFYYVLKERMKLDSVNVIANGEITQATTNAVVITIYGNDQATAAFEWNTKTAKQGTISDATLTSLVDKDSLKTVFEADDIIKVDIGKGGTGQDADFNLMLNFTQARKV